VLLVGVFLSFSTHATIYKCIINGVPTFTQFSCGENAEEIEIKLPPKNSPDNSSQPVSKSKKGDISVEDYLEIQQIERQIAKHQLEIKEIKQKLAERLKVINYMTQDKANRIGASSIQDAINTQSAAIKESTENAINAELQQIEVLNKRKLALQN
jgi:hypothetical protein